MFRKRNSNKYFNTPKILLPIFFLLLFISNSTQNIFARSKEFKNKRIINKSIAKYEQKIIKPLNEQYISSINWEIINNSSSNIPPKWIEYEDYERNSLVPLQRETISELKKRITLNSLNRSLVFDNKIIGPDISWIVPSGLPWNKK